MTKWTSSIEGREEAIANEWSGQLAELTPEQIKTGLDNWAGDWPPSSQEFKKTCLGFSEKLSLEDLGKAKKIMPRCGESMRDYEKRVRNA